MRMMDLLVGMIKKTELQKSDNVRVFVEKQGDIYIIKDITLTPDGDILISVDI